MLHRIDLNTSHLQRRDPGQPHIGCVPRACRTVSPVGANPAATAVASAVQQLLAIATAPTPATAAVVANSFVATAVGAPLPPWPRPAYPRPRTMPAFRADERGMSELDYVGVANACAARSARWYEWAQQSAAPAELSRARGRSLPREGVHGHSAADYIAPVPKPVTEVLCDLDTSMAFSATYNCSVRSRRWDAFKRQDWGLVPTREDIARSSSLSREPALTFAPPIPPRAAGGHSRGAPIQQVATSQGPASRPAFTCGVPTTTTKLPCKQPVSAQGVRCKHHAAPTLPRPAAISVDTSDSEASGTSGGTDSASRGSSDSRRQQGRATASTKRTGGTPTRGRRDARKPELKQPTPPQPSQKSAAGSGSATAARRRGVQRGGSE